MSESDTVYLFDSSTGKWQMAAEFQIPNRAMNFGDGIFETMVFEGEKIRFFPSHLERLQKGLKILKLSAEGVDFSKLENWLASEFSGQRIRVRWNIFRNGAGKYTPESNGCHQTLHIQSLNLAPRIKARAAFAEQISLFPYPWSQCKTLNALPYVLAAQERVERNLDELILLDYKGKVAEASSSNIFWRKGKKVYTPSLDCGGIDGVGRRAILEKIPRLVSQGIFNSNELLSADQVWVSNVTGISYLEKIDSLEFSTEDWEPLQGIFE